MEAMFCVFGITIVALMLIGRRGTYRLKKDGFEFVPDDSFSGRGLV